MSTQKHPFERDLVFPESPSRQFSFRGGHALVNRVRWVFWHKQLTHAELHEYISVYGKRRKMGEDTLAGVRKIVCQCLTVADFMTYDFFHHILHDILDLNDYQVENVVQQDDGRGEKVKRAVDLYTVPIDRYTLEILIAAAGENAKQSVEGLPDILATADRRYMGGVIKAAIDTGNSLLHNPPYGGFGWSPVEALAQSDDKKMTVAFDATLFFEWASDVEIAALHKCNWEGNTATHAIAEFYATTKAKPLFDYLQTTRVLMDQAANYTCRIDPNRAMHWLEKYKPELHATLQSAAG